MALNPSRRLAGVTSMTIDGQPYEVVSDAVWRPSVPKRETLPSQSVISGYSETPQAGMLGATIRDNGSQSATNLGLLTNSVVVMFLPNGKTITGNGVWTTDFEEVKTIDGGISIKFEGPDVSEDLVA